jgi:hypothetical protein
MEYPKLKSAQYIRDYTLKLSFTDGTESEVNFKSELTGGIFEALKDPEYFRSFTFQSQFGTIEWDNGADFAPEFIYELSKASGQHMAGIDSRSRKSA